MLEKINKLLARKQYVWIILGFIVVIGIFFRTYNFHDWLPFNMDQGRDAILIGGVINGTKSIPLLGPEAGGTDFYLGPMPYYFQILSAKIFGNSPDKMAYPDLFSSILCIPLFFFFLRKYFNIKISITLTALLSVSTYAIVVSRFAWNPNSTPFWTILGFYAVHNTISQKNNHQMLWSIVAGLAIGIGVQLHTTFLLFFPITTIIIFVSLFIRKINFFKYFLIILTVSLCLNIPQFISEYQTSGHNTIEFFKGLRDKPNNHITLGDNILRDSACWIESGISIISGYEISSSCEINIKDTSFLKLLLFTLGMIFIFGGIFLGARYLYQEKDWDKKYFLIIIFLYLGIAYLIYIPLAYTLSTRYFVMLIFFPFIFLGFWMNFLAQKSHKIYIYFLFILILSLMISNLYFTYNSFVEFIDYENGRSNGIANVILKEMEGVSNFIISNSTGEKEVYITGNKRYLFKTFNSIKFLVEKSGIKISQINKSSTAVHGNIFHLHTLRKMKELSKGKISSLDFASYGRFSIYMTRNKQ